MKRVSLLKKNICSLKKTISNFQNIFKSNEEIFYSIYTNKKWISDQANSLAYNSGSGSDTRFSDSYINKISEYINQNNINSVVDIGCGDFRVGKKLLSFCSNVKYLGVECFQDIVDYNNESYGNDCVQFKKIDFAQPIVSTDIYIYKLALVRQVLQHLDNKAIQNFLINLQPFNHVIITEHQTNHPKVFNKNIRCGSSNRTEKGSGVYLDKEPFKQYIDGLSLLVSIPVDTETSINSYVVSMKSGKI